MRYIHKFVTMFVLVLLLVNGYCLALCCPGGWRVVDAGGRGHIWLSQTISICIECTLLSLCMRIKLLRLKTAHAVGQKRITRIGVDVDLK